MLICVAGDAHGRLDRMYRDVLAFEARLGIEFDVVLQVGDLGIWPDPSRVDRATRKHGDAGDFPSWVAERTRAPRSTIFVQGNHEDFEWLEQQRPGVEVHPGIHHLRNGSVFELGTPPYILRIAGLGGCYSWRDYKRPAGELRGAARRHYSSEEIDQLIAASREASPDILLLHDAPLGVVVSADGRASGALGLDQLVARLAPRACFFGRHHVRIEADVGGVRCIGLRQIGHPASLLGLEMRAGEGAWRNLGDFP